MSKQLERSLTATEMIEMLPNTLIVSYDSLCEFNDIDEILGERKQFVLLYLTLSEHVGHWTCVFVSDKRPNELQFFDSYGLAPDTDQFRGVDERLMERTTQSYSVLSELMAESRYKKITYNPYRLQTNKVSSCGRFVITRLWLKNLTDLEYFKFMNSSPYYPDKLATALVENALRGYILSPLAIVVHETINKGGKHEALPGSTDDDM